MKKKIAFLINSMGAAGAEKTVATIINQLKVEYDIHLILLTEFIEVPLEKEGITLRIIDKSPLHSKNRSLDILKIPILAHKVRKYLQRHDIGLCISFLNRSNFINGFVKRLGWKGTTILCERIHTSSHYSTSSFGDRLGRFLVKKLYNYGDLVITNSQGMAEDLKQNFNIHRPLTLLYNAINLEQTHQRSLELVDDAHFTPFTFVLAGRFHEQKNHRLLIDAVKEIENLSFQVLLIGKGPLEMEMQEYARSLGLGDKVQFLGFKPNPIKYIARSHCFLMTSNYEGFPNVLLESLACGTPVISTDCPTGPRELLDERGYTPTPATSTEYLQYGIIVPLGNTKTLADTMKQVILDPHILEGYKEKARERAADFSVSRTIERFQAIIKPYL
jgi:N-acetylgalactosamine-N,N'-diacetylbacillosaminyl-diphospho-undecaprenol 4-alpha-N-acetylgalactosaminyltransferase